jgi:hypothetical protein
MENMARNGNEHNNGNISFDYPVKLLNINNHVFSFHITFGYH